MYVAMTFGTTEEHTKVTLKDAQEVPGVNLVVFFQPCGDYPVDQRMPLRAWVKINGEWKEADDVQTH